MITAFAGSLRGASKTLLQAVLHFLCSVSSGFLGVVKGLLGMFLCGFLRFQRCLLGLIGFFFHRRRRLIGCVARSLLCFFPGVGCGLVGSFCYRLLRVRGGFAGRRLRVVYRLLRVVPSNSLLRRAQVERKM